MALSEKTEWSGITTIMDGVSVTTGSDSDVVDLATLGYANAHLTVYGDFPGSPTDDLDVLVYASLDGVSFDKTPLFSIRLDKAPDPNQLSFTIKGVAQLKVHAKRTGATDTIATTIKCRCWNERRWV